MNKNKDLGLSTPRLPYSERPDRYAPPGAHAFGPVGERLTDAQRIFVEQYVNSGGQRSVAGEAAGVSRTYVTLLLRDPKIHDAMHAYRESVIRTEGGAVGLQVLLELAREPDTPYVIRHRAAKDLIELAGHMKPQANQVLAADKPLMEMSIEELQAFINAGAGAVETLKNQQLRTIEGEAVLDPADNPADRHSAQNSAQLDDEDDFFA